MCTKAIKITRPDKKVNRAMKVSLEHLQRYCSIRPTRHRRQILRKNLPAYRKLLKKEYNGLLQDSMVVIIRYRELRADTNPPLQKLVHWQLDDLSTVLQPCYIGTVGTMDENEEVVRLEWARKIMEQIKITLDDDKRVLTSYIREKRGTVESTQAE